MRYVWRAWVCLHIWEGNRALIPAFKKYLWSQFQQDRSCSWHRMDVGSKSDLYELLKKDCRQKVCIYSTADQRPLWWLFSNPQWLRRAAAWWNVSPRQITNSGNRQQRAGCDSKVVNLWMLKNWTSNFLEQIPSWELVKNIQMPWTMIAIWCCKIWCYFGFLVWPGSSMFSIASRPFG